MADSVFDSDTHTFKDGAMARFLKMRKWFVVTTLLLLFLSNGWMDYAKIKSALGVPGIPVAYFQTFLTLSGCYLLAQACLVLWQLRLVYRRGLFTLPESVVIADIENLRHAMTQLERKLTRTPANVVYPPEERAADELEAARLRKEYEKCSRFNVMARGSVVGTELAIDVMRVVPVFVLLLYAVVAHGNLSGLAGMVGAVL